MERAYQSEEILFLDYSKEEASCPFCGKRAKRNKSYIRTLKDICIERERRIAVKISSHHCLDCKRYFSISTTFAGKRARYTDIAKDKSIQWWGHYIPFGRPSSFYLGHG